MKNRIVYTYTFRKKGFKPFSKLITNELPHSITYGDLIPLNQIETIIKQISDKFINGELAKDINTLSINCTVIYNNHKIKIKTERLTRI